MNNIDKRQKYFIKCIMNLADGEFTTQSFIEFLKKKFVKKTTGSDFTANDVAQYLMRGATPYRYGHFTLNSNKVSGVRIIQVEELIKK